MLPFIPLIGLFANIVLQALGLGGVLTPQTTTTINGLIGGIVPLLGTLTSKQTTTSDVLAVLAGLSSIIATLKADTNLPQDKLALVQVYDSEVQAAILAYIQAGKGLDLSVFTPIAPV